MFNPERDISGEAINAISNIIECYTIGTRACILFAQMQCGKTIAFLLLAGEMLRLKKVDNVIIFTGNREKELKEQLHTQIKGNSKKSSFFDNLYCNYLAKNINIFEGLSFLEGFSMARDLIMEIKQKITIIWGTELIKKASRINTENTLFIFEESHFAQSIGQSPDKFLKMIGLPANGDNELLKEKNNYYCSISATPFSEICDNGNLKQSKYVVRMEPGLGYRGVKWLKENGKIIGFDNWETSLRDALYSKKDECNWAIVRVRGDEQMKIAERICLTSEWNVRKYDQEHSDKLFKMKTLENKPRTSTVIILRERCRMGTVVPKKHLAFLFETSASSNTDTLLQGLLGRACGYHVNDTLIVYINRNILNRGEIETYINFCEGDEKSIPNYAKNIIVDDKISKIGKKTLSTIIPIHIPRRCISEETTFEKTEELIRHVLNAIENDEIVIQNNHNPENIKEKIIELCKEFIKEGNEKKRKKIQKHCLSHPTYKDVPRKIINAIQNKKPAKLSSGCGGCSLYYVDTYIEGLETGSYYLCCYLNLTQDEVIDLFSKREKKLPNTNGEEIFRYRNLLETGEVELTNGGFCLSLKPETATDKNIMLETIRECVLRSKETNTYLIVPSRINSIRQPGFDKFTGIFVSKEVYNSLISDGEIYNTIKNEFGVILKITHSRGRPIDMKNMPQGCFKRIAEISW